jgi:hypothetical protein
MIPPNELRIGNWVSQKVETKCGYVVKMFKVTNGDFYDNTVMPVFDHLEPIPLTPEILERAGFGCRAGNVYYKEGVVDSLIYQYDGFIVWEVNNMVIKYLHWLQNLYFCLTTGKELEINDPVTK